MPHDRHASESGDAPADTAAAIADRAALWDIVSECTNDFVLIVDRDGVMRYVNRMTPTTKSTDIIGHSIYEFAEPESAHRLRQAVARVFAGSDEEMLETTGHDTSGETTGFFARLRPLRRDGTTLAVMLCASDAMPLKRSQQSLDRERHVLRRLLEIQERERQLVSYEIHDGLAQYLAGAMMHLEACEHAAAGTPMTCDLHEGLRLLRAATAEARRLISGLRPPALDELGIIDAIETLVTEARLDVPDVRFDHTLPAGRLSPDVETTIFRIVQESLANVRRHARAGSVAIRLESAAVGGVRIMVQDDGVGFDPAAVPADRFGLEGIRQRARLLGGEPVLTSRPGGGTTIDVVLPPPATESSMAHVVLPPV